MPVEIIYCATRQESSVPPKSFLVLTIQSFTAMSLMQQHLPDLKLSILREQHPNSVHFLAISSGFAGMTRAKRAVFLTDRSKAVLGPVFYDGLYIGSALTQVEYGALSASGSFDTDTIDSASTVPAAAPTTIYEIE